MKDKNSDEVRKKIKIKIGGIIVNKKVLTSLVSIFIFSILLVACNNSEGETVEKTSNDTSEQEVYEEKVLNIGATSDILTFNDLYTTQGADREVAGLVFSSLTTIDATGEATPDLAESWENSDDGLIWTFHLKENVTWHDGEPFTADDVVFTYSIPLAEDYTGPRAYNFEAIDTIEALDDYTVQITLKEVVASFLSRTTTFNILPEHILGNVPIAELGEHEFNTKKPIGTGPFKFDEWAQGQYIKLVANDDYFDGRPDIDVLYRKEVPDSNSMLAQFIAGDIDFLSLSSEDLPEAESLVNQGQATLVSGLSSGYTHIEYNLRNPLFEDKRVRQALTHALNREEMVEVILEGNGEVAHSPGLPLLWAFNEDVPKFEYNPEKAKELLAEAGWVNTDDDGILVNDKGERFSFDILGNPTNEIRKQMIQVAQQQWKEVGIEAVPQFMEGNALLEKIGSPNWDYDSALLGWSVSLDPSVTGFFHSDEIEKGLNRGGYSNPELDKLMKKSDQTVDQEERKKLIEEIHEIIAEDQPYTFLYYSNSSRLHVPNLKGVEHHPTSTFFQISKWTLEE